MSGPKRADASVAARLWRALLIPAALVVIAGVLIVVRLARLAEDTQWVASTNDVLAHAEEAYRRAVDEETFMRGFLITEDPAFLEQYRGTRSRDIFAALARSTAGDPARSERVAEVVRRHAAWRALADEIVDPKADLAPFRTTASVALRKEKMDATRAAMEALISETQRDLHARAASAHETQQSTRTLVIGLFVLLGASLGFFTRREVSGISAGYEDMLSAESKMRARLEDQDWTGAGVIDLSEKVQGELTKADLAARALDAIATRTQADVGALFLREGEAWVLAAGHGFDPAEPVRMKGKHGLVGRAAKLGKPLHVEAPDGYLKIVSGLGEAKPLRLAVVPACAENKVEAVVELGFFREISDRDKSYLERVSEPLAIALRSATYRARLNELFGQAKKQAEELQTQSEELRVTNEELEEQGTSLRKAQAELEEQQSELEATNANLEAQAEELRQAQVLLETRAAELQKASRYKSDFLANMSHELRTPLNSTLILAKLLADNRAGNLTEEQVRYARTIRGAGNDLLNLINDILDLSKIEAGRMDVQLVDLGLEALIEPVTNMFEPIAKDKGIELVVDLARASGRTVRTDQQKTQQILKNLLSNALKFTDAGRVTLTANWSGNTLDIAVTDTGIGIGADQLERVFSAFHQADATTSRKYGGTGLGLSISRELAKLMNGDIVATSTVGAGSTFTLSLPDANAAEAKPRPVPARRSVAQALGKSTPAASPSARSAEDPVPATTPRGGGARLLIVEDDKSFATILADIVRDLGYEPLVTETAADAIALASKEIPRAVLLDIRLPGESGLVVIDALKREPSTRHIPIHVVSAEDYREQALTIGAAGYLIKPVTREAIIEAVSKLETIVSNRPKRILLVEDDATQRASLGVLLRDTGAEVAEASTASEAVRELETGSFDCIVTDLRLPDADGDEVLGAITAARAEIPPIIVYTGRALTPDEEMRLRELSSSIIVKGARSPERLLDELSLFLHQVESELPVERQRLLAQVRDREEILAGRTVMLVEDDVRNIFALTSVLEQKNIRLVVARNGKEALEKAEVEPNIDLVLMDIMMPEMDGYEAMRRLRARPQTKKTPIIALTAKAMADDHQRCLQAGANDYAPKPLDVDRLLSLLRVWMPPRS